MADDARPIVSVSAPGTSFPGYWERRFTVEEFAVIGSSGVLSGPGKHELRDGRIVVSPPAGSRHGRSEAAVVELLAIAIRELGISRDSLIVQPHPGLKLGASTYLEPEAAVLAPVDVAVQAFYAPKDVRLVAETAHTSLADDLGYKREKYAAAEIPEYWVLDVTAEVVYVFRQPSRGDYTAQVEYRPGETLSPLFEPRIQIAVAELF